MRDMRYELHGYVARAGEVLVGWCFYDVDEMIASILGETCFIFSNESGG